MQETSAVLVESQDESPSLSLSGVEAILSNTSFSNKASSMYILSVRSYLDIQHSPSIQNQLNSIEPNIMYSINASALWQLLKEKIKKIGRIQLFDNSSDKMIIKFAITFASFLGLNDAKEKVMEKEKEMLRKDIKEYIQGRVSNQLKRKTSILQQFNKSTFFNNKIVEDLKLTVEQRQELKNMLVEFKFSKSPILISFLQKCLSLIQKSIQKKDAELRQKVTSSGVKVESITREAYGMLLLCNYLNLYIIIGDWIKILLNDKGKRLNQLIFAHVIENKGFHIINRVIDDAPLNTIAQEIKAFQNNFYK